MLFRSSEFGKGRNNTQTKYASSYSTNHPLSSPLQDTVPYLLQTRCFLPALLLVENSTKRRSVRLPLARFLQRPNLTGPNCALNSTLKHKRIPAAHPTCQVSSRTAVPRLLHRRSRRPPASSPAVSPPTVQGLIRVEAFVLFLISCI